LSNSPLIQCAGLVRTYQLGETLVKALNHVDIKIDRGEFIAIMGPSGSGKSTLMNILGCLDTPSEGSYQLNGREIASQTDEELSATRNQNFGFVFQSFHLLPRLTALDNVLLPVRYAPNPDMAKVTERAKELLTKLGLGKHMMHRPNQLSGGQRQRVAIARSLINEPDVLFADEPTGALDSKTSVEIMDLFKSLNEAGQTIIMVTHEQEVADEAKRVLIMRDGVLAEEVVQ